MGGGGCTEVPDGYRFASENRTNEIGNNIRKVCYLYFQLSNNFPLIVLPPQNVSVSLLIKVIWASDINIGPVGFRDVLAQVMKNP